MPARAVAVMVLLVSGLAAAQPVAGIDPELERQARADVAHASSEAALAFDQANAARDAGRADEAINAYRRATELAPGVDHPHRRLCSTLSMTGRSQEGIDACERALSLRPDSPYNKSSLALALLGRAGPGDVTRAADLAREAAAAAPKDAGLTQIWCQAAMQAGILFVLQQCSERLLTLDPDGVMANFYGALVAVEARDFDEAQRLLRKARAAGLPADVYESMRAAVGQAERDSQWLPISGDTAIEIGAVSFGAWILAFILLFVIGNSLSQATLRRVDHSAIEATGSARERRLRRTYKVVLALVSAFFYLSLPVMIVVVIAVSIGVILIFDEMGGTPIIVLWLLGVMVIATIVAILRSVLAPAKTKPYGQPIDLAANPQLRALLDEVAATIGTRGVDTGYLVPGTEMAVSERGSLWRTLRGKPSERVLYMGVALFDGMTQLQLRSILAHEHGHFHNEDTSGAGFVLAARRSLLSLIERMGESGVAHFFNPAWWFVRVFYQMYLAISHGASRLQEMLADRWAARAYGSAAFVAGYRHVVTRAVEFEHDLDALIKEAVDNQWPLVNLYELEPNDKRSDEELASAVAAEMTRAPDLFDSHPCAQQRIEWVERLAIVREPEPQDDAPVWDLFESPEAIERAMTAIVRDDVQTSLGVLIAAKAADEIEPEATASGG